MTDPHDNDNNGSTKVPEIDATFGSAPLGRQAVEDLPKIHPGMTLKNAPDDYFHGPASQQGAYWRRRAETAEARCAALRLELESSREIHRGALQVAIEIGDSQRKAIARAAELLNVSIEWLILGSNAVISKEKQ